MPRTSCVHHWSPCTLCAAIFIALTGCASSSSTSSTKPASSADASALLADDGPGMAGISGVPRIYTGFGNYTRTVTTSSPEAQRWFNQGMQLLYGFNHDEAIRSFRQAAHADPNCAMAWWGVSYANGLHINNPLMTEEQSRNGYEAAQEAMKHMPNASPPEQALIRAVAARYEWPAPSDRRFLDEAYAAAMENAHTAFPDDPDIASLFAESLMDLQPWDYWTHEGQPKGRIEEIVKALERTLENHPNHPGANHFYIHAVEASPHPAKAEQAADRLRTLVPGSGHLVHMPSHIDIRLGKYQQAAETNQRAIMVDEQYFAIAPPPRFYRIYFIHNVHFLAYASMMEGRFNTAMRAARTIEQKVPEAFLREYAMGADGLTPVTFHVLVRFGKWEEILQEPEPAAYRLISRAMHRYARCVALAALGRTDEAAKELQAFDAVAASVTDVGSGGGWFVGNNAADDVLAIARLMAEGELAYRLGDHERSFALLREAIRRQDNLRYDEPPGWMMPVRHALGALLMGGAARVDDPAQAHEWREEALQVYRDDLVRHRNNIWSLVGLEQGLRWKKEYVQALADAGVLDGWRVPGVLSDIDDELRIITYERTKAWQRKDVEITSSCYCQPHKELKLHTRPQDVR